MSFPKVFVTRQIDPGVLSELTRVAEVKTWPNADPPPYEVLQSEIGQLDGILTLLTDRIDASLLQSAGPQLKIVSQMAVGYDNIDVPTATRLKIPVGHTPGVLTETTADFAWALLMACARRVVEADQEVRQGIWRPWGPDVLTGPDVHGGTIGIIGFGRIGQAIARRAAGFNMKILYSDIQSNPEAEQATGANYVSMDELLAQSDFVSVHVYLSPQTRHLIGAPQLRAMKPTAILINTSRGPIVDPDALTAALQGGVIAAAGLDVFDPEPIPAGHPILALPNLVITPHIASASKPTRRLMAKMAVENILAALQGQRIPYCANPDVYN